MIPTRLSSLPGVFDILPKMAGVQNINYWQQVEKTAKETAKTYSFSEVRTPIIEPTELFIKSVGESSDIVTKEMYTFKDLKGRSITLRPEGTAPLMRALMEANRSFARHYYIGPMFRYERQQKGRFRQHHQFGAEAVGAASPEMDAEMISLLYTFYTKLGLKHLRVDLNSIGNVTTRKKYRDYLVSFFGKHKSNLSQESINRLNVNPLRILDSKNEEDQKIVRATDPIDHFLNPDERKRIGTVERCLNDLQIPYQKNHTLVRGLDYYNETVFEILPTKGGKSLGGGGRYDRLMDTLGGESLPAVGFGCGLERVIDEMIEQNVTSEKDFGPKLYLIPLGERALSISVILANTLRSNGTSTEVNYDNGRMNKKLKRVYEEIKPEYLVVFGDNELDSQIVDMKEMKTEVVHKVALKSLKDDRRLKDINTGGDC